MKRTRTLLDCDGVLADFTTKARADVERITGKPMADDFLDDWDLYRNYTRAEQKTFYDACKQPGWCASLDVLPGALAGVAALREVSDVYFVTSPMGGPNWAHERTEWLVKHFDASYKHVVHTHSKYLCVGDVFVDDKADHIVEWSHHHRGNAILWAAPYNKKNVGLFRTSDWNDVLIRATR